MKKFEKIISEMTVKDLAMARVFPPDEQDCRYSTLDLRETFEFFEDALEAEIEYLMQEI